MNLTITVNWWYSDGSTLRHDRTRQHYSIGDVYHRPLPLTVHRPPYDPSTSRCGPKLRSACFHVHLSTAERLSMSANTDSVPTECVCAWNWTPASGTALSGDWMDRVRSKRHFNSVTVPETWSPSTFEVRCYRELDRNHVNLANRSFTCIVSLFFVFSVLCRHQAALGAQDRQLMLWSWAVMTVDIPGLSVSTWTTRMCARADRTGCSFTYNDLILMVPCFRFVHYAVYYRISLKLTIHN